MEEKYMRRAIELAKLGIGKVNPNPLVGAVIVKDGKIIGEGWHERYGELHAERNALKNAKESVKGADIYVTLEPCCHTGKQPPCTEAIIESGIKRVIIGSEDPNPVVNGGGVKILKEAGIEVIEGFLREECDAINPVFMHYITKKNPYVLMKFAMTMDGKIAAKTGASRYVSGEESRAEVQRLRNEYKGIMVGIGTVIADDPMLNCRMEGGRNPIRIVCDSRLRIPESSKLVNTAKDIETIVITADPLIKKGEITIKDVPDKEKKVREKISVLLNKGVKILNYPSNGGTHVDLKASLAALGKKGIDGILLEGGGTLNESMLKDELVQEMRIFLAPKVFGGQAKTPVEGIGVDQPSEAKRFIWKDVKKTGDDLMITAVPAKS